MDPLRIKKVELDETDLSAQTFVMRPFRGQ